MTRILVAARLMVLALVSLVLVPLQLLALRFGWSILHAVPVWFHRVLLRLFNVRVTERGKPPGEAATLVVANHVSWLDIPVIGSLHPLSFIAKSEIEGWPVVGHLARLQRSVFIDRQRRKATAEVNDALAHRLVKGEAIVLFAEGTTSDGNRLLPFRSSLVGAAQTALMHDSVERVLLQPLAITYTRRHGLPVTRRDRPFIAWYGDMDLAPHLKMFVRATPLDVVVTWGEPIPFNGNRKEATAQAEAAVRRTVKAA
ncbi:lysophospholipid acyltransferase family protein [Microvirga subterranea]|uniref:Lyso-ornithine lipid acyltransferase n=1 Tax=Microvirga subterranea TaxID=186651 RepID=A0A370HUJ7_9HYPH|nr:lysophospholipid acyltransferase family protein [Microvirga subterranea]RDI62189.1 lyso-ornithine lipid acyltransferase [Microvirga subterranea]